MAKKNSEKGQESQGSMASVGASGSSESSGNGNGKGNDRISGGGALGGGREIVASPDEIAARAYEIYEREGRSDGRAMDHWLQAESELRAEKQNRGGSAPNPQSRQDSPRSARQHQEGTSGISRPGSAQ